jgi:hypothetical protein
MIHVDEKKVGRIPDGGGWRVHSRGSDAHRAVDRAKTTGAKAGYVYLHSAVDGFSRLAYTEPLAPAAPRRPAVGAAEPDDDPLAAGEVIERLECHGGEGRRAGDDLGGPRAAFQSVGVRGDACEQRGTSPRAHISQP